MCYPNPSHGVSGQVVGLSDTGIDEHSCYFRDDEHGQVRLHPLRLSVCPSAWIPLLSPSPQVPRSDVDHLIVETKYRKVIEYVNFSGSAGDYRSGYLSQWLWPWQPNLIFL